MRVVWILIVAGLVVGSLAMLGGSGDAQAQTEFKVALAKKYTGMTVSCNACHVSGEEKTVRNDFGKLFVKELEGKNVTKRLNDVKSLEVDDPARVKVKEAVTAEFLAALTKIEAAKSPSGPTYGELLKAGKQEGVTPKEE